MTVTTGYRSGKRVEKEGAASVDFGPAIEKLSATGPEPDAQAEIDGRRLMARPMTADISGDLPGAAAQIAAALMGRPTGRKVEAPCGCGRYTCCDEGKRLSRESQAAYRTEAYEGLVGELRAHRAAAEAAIAAGIKAA